MYYLSEGAAWRRRARRMRLPRARSAIAPATTLPSAPVTASLRWRAGVGVVDSVGTGAGVVDGVGVDGVGVGLGLDVTDGVGTGV